MKRVVVSSSIRFASYVIVILLLLSCGGGKYKKIQSSDDATDLYQVENSEASAEEDTLDVYFLGYRIHCAGKDIANEFARICDDDSNLTFNCKNRNVGIYGTLFHLNTEKGGFVLFSSVQPDSRQMNVVRDAFSRYHGKMEEESDFHYSWTASNDSAKDAPRSPNIRMRRAYSEEGGTMILVN